jgi:hypothetical protein
LHSLRGHRKNEGASIEDSTSYKKKRVSRDEVDLKEASDVSKEMGE